MEIKERAWKPEKRKYGSKRNVYINRHLKDGLGIEFTAC